jgi:hypothetical protein
LRGHTLRHCEGLSVGRKRSADYSAAKRAAVMRCLFLWWTNAKYLLGEFDRFEISGHVPASVAFRCRRRCGSLPLSGVRGLRLSWLPVLDAAGRGSCLSSRWGISKRGALLVGRCITPNACALQRISILGLRSQGLRSWRHARDAPKTKQPLLSHPPES